MAIELVDCPDCGKSFIDGRRMKIHRATSKTCSPPGGGYLTEDDL